MVRPVATINVVPNLPEPLQRLRELAYNLRWAWDHDTIALFRRLDPDLWQDTYHNPVLMLGQIDQDKLEAAAEDASFLAHMNLVCDSFDAYMGADDTWFNTHYQKFDNRIIAYFSMEFGLTESLQSYSGGLGILSGDHMKSASDLGVPLVGVGLLYQEGYFQQYLNADGFQQESYPINDYANLPVELQRDADGNPIKISVPLPGRELHAVIWKVQVGRVPLYLLDANIPDNTRDEDRNLTDRLYGGDRRTRIRQEILMGIGGIRALDALGIEPTVCHMNEGHSAFLGLERIRRLMESDNLTFDQARTILAAGTVFTTHTPVPAGLERFGFDLVDEHFTDYIRKLGLTRDAFLDLGRENMGTYELFSMPTLALNISSSSNGVARLHGAVSRGMWQSMFPDAPVDEVPIGSVTNGIHVMSWISGEMAQLFDRYLTPEWKEEIEKPETWADVERIPDGELWRAHTRRRSRLVTFVRKRLRQQLEERGVSQSEVDSADEVLNPEVLTIGFARRFATYKRATLILRDQERLSAILNDPQRPVQLVFAGKAHPHDTAGKELIREIVNLARNPEFRNRLVFLENYDINIGRYMYQGVDVWLNNPRRPKEASGTSGMKCIYNGALNCSILDGWWDEGYNPSVGWAIGRGEEYDESAWEQQDYIESQALYNVIEQDIVPLFYDRDGDDLPRGWVGKMKNAMTQLAPFFTTRRMVQEYTTNYYMPSYDRALEVTANEYEKGLAYEEWRSSTIASWRGVKIQEVDVPNDQLHVGTDMEVKAVISLGDLMPDDVRVQLYLGALDTRGQILPGGEAIDMQSQGSNGGDTYTFTGHFTYGTSGDRGLSVRVLPKHDLMTSPFSLRLVSWA